MEATGIIYGYYIGIITNPKPPKASVQLASGRLRPRHLFGFMFDAARQGGGQVKI